MSIELTHVMARKRAVLLALILWCLVLVLGVLYLFSQRSNVLPPAPVAKNAIMRAADNAAARYQDLSLRPSMLATVAVVFDSNNQLVSYVPALDTDKKGKGIVEEASIFDTPQAKYEFMLTSTKSPTNATTYITDSLQLTVTEHTKGGEVEVVYVDNAVDGVLDAVYVDGVRVTDASFFAAAQDQYIAELTVARNYLLGLTNK